MKKLLVGGVVLSLLIMQGCGSDSKDLPEISSKQLLGDAIFHDVNLSNNGTQSCSTCHDPDNGFVDTRDVDGNLGSTPYAASLGDDGMSLGGRNAPMAAYAALSPEFSQGTRQRQGQQQVTHGSYDGYLGGQFWDGRESNLAGQAGGPPTNALEMGMANKAAVVDVLLQNSKYVESFEHFYGADIFDDAAAENPAAYDAMADAIAQFETLDEEKFLAFNSKYDKSLAFPAEYEYSGKASAGNTLFFSSDFSCAACHQSKALPSREEPFTSFEYHNIGVPENSELKETRNALLIGGALDIDLGLAHNANIAVEDVEISKGKFKVPSLRNIAVTAPYMHNGTFDTLEAVLAFYKHMDIGNVINPEGAGEVFSAPEVSQNISISILQANRDDLLTDENLEEIECFLLTLTDEQYEHLLDSTKVDECSI